MLSSFAQPLVFYLRSRYPTSTTMSPLNNEMKAMILNCKDDGIFIMDIHTKSIDPNYDHTLK